MKLINVWDGKNVIPEKTLPLGAKLVGLRFDKIEFSVAEINEINSLHSARNRSNADWTKYRNRVRYINVSILAQRNAKSKDKFPTFESLIKSK